MSSPPVEFLPDVKLTWAYNHVKNYLYSSLVCSLGAVLLALPSRIHPAWPCLDYIVGIILLGSALGLGVWNFFDALRFGRFFVPQRCRVVYGVVAFLIAVFEVILVVGLAAWFFLNYSKLSHLLF